VTKEISQGPGTLDVEFFPEGGNLIPGVENRIAFKALNSLGKSEDVHGDIVDETGNTVVSFKADHAGMGMIRLTPILLKKYRARINRAGWEYYFHLPEVENGYMMRTTMDDKKIQVTAYTNIKISSPVPVYLLAQSRGIIYYAVKGTLIGNTLVAAIPKDAFPTGIVQITLLDASFIPQCERLVYINKDDNLVVNIRPDKQKFKKRANAEIEITALKKDGTPASGNFSLSVYDAANMPTQPPYGISIDNYLLLSSDLRGNIEEPGYYLKDTLNETKYHLDLLMMTQGWRRFTWKEIMTQPIIPLVHQVENGIVLSGLIERAFVDKPSPNMEIKIVTSTGELIVTKSNSFGKFYVDSLSYYDSTRIAIQTDNAKGKQANLKLKVDPFNSPPDFTRTLSIAPSVEATALVKQTEERTRIQNLFQLDKESIVLKEVDVKASRITESEPLPIYGIADNTIKMTDADLSYPNVLLALQGRIAGVNVTSGGISIRGSSQPPLYVLDGMILSDGSAISNLSPTQVDHVDVLKGPSTAIYGARGANGVIIVYTKRGEGIPPKPPLGIYNLSYPGYTKAREFYSPNYSTPPQNENIPDIRTTLYWNPSIQLDEDGKAKVSFFTSDVLSSYDVEVEGISEDGYPGVGKAGIRVSE